MLSHECAREGLAVIKIGGSIFAGPEDYRTAARFLERRLAESAGDGLVVVVSAQYGATDSLLGEAQAILPEPDSAALDLLWSTGELRSVALLALHLQALGIAAAPLSVHETGLRVRGRNGSAASAEFDSSGIEAALNRCAIAIVPGFLGVNEAGAIVSLGRGGSDLTAVLLAAGLGASRCELVKDVAGYFSTDPHVDAQAAHLPQLSYETAIAMARAGCDLVQRQALEAAEQAGLALVVRSLDENAPTSWIIAASVRESEKLAQTVT